MKNDIGMQSAVFDCGICGVNNCQHILTVDDRMGYKKRVFFPQPDGEDIPHETHRHNYIYRCSGCGGNTYFLVENWRAMMIYGNHSRDPGREVFSEGRRLLHQYPVATPVSHPAVTGDIEKAANEAEKCFAVGAANACGTMARRAVDALAQDKGAAGKNLYTRLEDLKNNQIIAHDIWESAEELRTAGKLGAHPEWEDLTLVEAKHVIYLLREILRYVYINPFERKARQLKGVKGKKP